MIEVDFAYTYLTVIDLDESQNLLELSLVS